MSITLISKKGISERPLVRDLVNIILDNPNDFIYIARIFSNYPNNKKVDIIEIENQVRNVLAMTFISAERVEIIVALLLRIYESRKFDDIRSEVLENIVYHFGPVTPKLHFEKCFIEPEIKDSDIVIGESQIKCDLVFYSNDKNPLEFIECKTNISNVIPWNRRFEKMSQSHQRKINYLKNVYHYLREHYCEPKIYFACYNENYDNEIENLHKNWEFHFIDIVSPLEIINNIKSKSFIK